MPKFKIACFLLATLLAAVGTVLFVKNLGGEDIPEFEKPTEDLNTYLDKTEDMDIDDSSADVREFLFVAHKLLLSGKGFYGVADGTSTAVGIKQYVRNTRYVVGEFGHKNILKEMVTKGIVGKAYQLYMWDDNYVYRKGAKINAIDDVNWAATAQALTEDAFYNDFGHRNDKLTGYILNWDTVTSGEFVSKNDGVYTFRYVLDAEVSSKYLRREMIFNGGLNSEPTFNRCVIYVSMDADFNVKSLRTDCEYKAQTMGINATCTEDITELFYPYEGDLPEKDFFEQYFTENPDTGIVEEKTALDVLMEMFSPYLNGEDLQVAIAASYKGENLVNGLVSVEGLDISDLSKLTVNAQVGDIDLAYVHDGGTIYLKYQDFKASTTVNGVMELVSTLTPLFGGGDVDSVALDDFDVAALLDNLTYSIDGDKIIVSLPINLGELAIDAKLYGDVVGETYTFTNAIIECGEVEVVITPHEWTVAERVGAYPEILGLADLLQDGKIALNAELMFGDYSVNADVLVDLATFNLSVTANVNDYGTVGVVYVDGIAYVAFGGVKLKLDTANIDELFDLIYKYTGKKIEFSTPSLDISAQSILALLSGITATNTEGGVDFNLTVMGVDVTLRLANNDGLWQMDSLTAIADGIKAVIVGGDAIDDVTVPRDADSYVDVNELVDTFVDPIMDIVNANGYAIGLDGKVTIDGKTYRINATLTLVGSNVHVIFELYYNGISMIDGELWVVDGMLYLHADDFKLAVELGETDNGNSDFNVDSLKETLQNVKGYRNSIDDVIDLVLTLLDTQFDSLTYDEIITALSFENGKLTLDIDGKQFGLSDFTLCLGANDGLTLSLRNLSYKNITLNITSASVEAYDGWINGPGADEDFTTNLVIDVQEYSTTNRSGEHNVIYVNLDLVKGVVLARIETEMPDGSKTFLDVKYTFADNVLKLTNGSGINVLVNINSISDIVNRINDIVNEFANAGDQTLPDLFESVGEDFDLKAIIQSLTIGSENGNVIVALNAMNFEINAILNNGIRSITVPVDMIESNLVVKFSWDKAAYSEFSDDASHYVSIDQVFNDFYYGTGGTQDQPAGAIYNLVHTNSWKFDFLSDSEIDVVNDDGSTTVYNIVQGSYLAFYYNKTDAANFKVRANITVQKNRGEFLYLDVAFFDGRIYATYDSRKWDVSSNGKQTANKNELRATVSLDALKETIDLLPALIKVVPQIGTLMDNMSEAMNSMESKLTLGNVSKILQSVSYDVVDGRNVFTLQINGQAIDANNFDKEPITLKVSNYGTEGLSLDELSLSYGKVSVNLTNLVVTGSEINEKTGEFVFVEDYIYSYDTSNHINLDSIRELLSAFIITADNVDENGNRSFTIEGTINATLLKNQAIIGITIYVDIDKDNNVYLAVKLSRDAKGVLSGAIYADDGGYSYMLLNGKEGTISLYRNSYSDYTYCSRCKNWTCSYTVLHAAWRSKSSYLDTEAPVGNKLPSFMLENMTLSEFTADTKTMVGYILDTLNFGSLIDGQIRSAVGKENNNVYGIEDIFKSYTYTYVEQEEKGTFAIRVDLSPIDSALGEITANIVHVGNFDNIGYDEDGNVNDGGVKLTEINGTATMISIMDAKYELKLLDPSSGTAFSYVINGNYLW